LIISDIYPEGIYFNPCKRVKHIPTYEPEEKRTFLPWLCRKWDDVSQYYGLKGICQSCSGNDNELPT